MGKLPYIPDKKLYAAVMGACSYVRETGYFNKAVNYYADKYNVDVEDVKKYVRMAQGNGQRKAAAKTAAHYKWFVIIAMQDYYQAGDEGHYSSWDWNNEEKIKHCKIFVKRALSEKNARVAIDNAGLDRVSAPALFDTPHHEMRVLSISEYQSKDEAENAAAATTREDVMRAIGKSSL